MAATLAPVRFADEIGAEPSELAAVRDALADALGACEWPDEDAFRVLICADEAMANVLCHATSSGDGIATRFHVSPDKTTLVVADGGTPAAFTLDPPVPGEASEHGRGLILMRAFADSIRVWRCPARTLVALQFNRVQGGA